MTISSIPRWLNFRDFYDHQGMMSPPIVIIHVSTIPPCTISPASSASLPLLLLRTKSRRTNIASPQLNTQNLLHRPKNLLIRRRTSSLEVRDNRLSSIALCSQILLCHLGLHLLALRGDDIADFLADGVGLDDVVAAVNFGEMLAFDAGFGGLVGLVGDA